MVELKAKSPCAGMVPSRIGTVTLDELDVGALTSLSPFGDSSEFDRALKKAHGVGWPEPGQAVNGKDARVIWFGREEALLIGPAVKASLGAQAAVVDQSDAWAVIGVEGAAAVDVLARLMPIDLRDATFPVGNTARTQLQHVSASITKTGADQFMILVFRSMAATVIHELKQAMEGVASRG